MNSAGYQYSFDRVPTASLPRTRIPRPSTHKTTINAGLLYPLFVDEVLPGDTYTLNVSSLARFTTLLAPIMDNLYLDWQFFFVPTRLVWDNWQKMHGERVDPDDDIDYTVPNLTCPDGGVSSGSIHDYFGLPIGKKWLDGDVNCLYHRAYNLIWNEWFRNENLQNSVTVKRDDTDDSASDYVLLPRGKRKDYFTGALPSPQKGDSVKLPIGTSAPVIGNGLAIGFTDGTVDGITLSDRAAGQSNAHLASLVTGQGGDPIGTARGNNFYDQAKLVGVSLDADNSGLIADLTEASSASIESIREAFALQRLLERDNIGGTRYVELLRSHFGVISPDARLQRPEFLGSFTIPIQINTVTQSSATEASGTVQGNLVGVGTGIGSNRAFTKSFVEHGMLFGLASIRSNLTYQQGLPRMFSKFSRFDYYIPELAHLGDQYICNKEIYFQGNVNDVSGNRIDNLAFGWSERWSEYKFGTNKITGKLRSGLADSLDVWHLSQEFASLPTLNSQFFVENPPISRVVAVADQPAFILDTFFDLVTVRSMPLYSTPGVGKF